MSDTMIGSGRKSPRGRPSEAATQLANGDMTAPMSHGGHTQWPHFANMVLGLWLITSVFALDYKSAPLRTSDIASGAFIILFAAWSLSNRPSL